MIKPYHKLLLIPMGILIIVLVIFIFKSTQSDSVGENIDTEFESDTELGVKEDNSVKPLGSDYVWTKGWFHIGKTCFTDLISHKAIIDAGGVLVEGQSEALASRYESRDYIFENVTLTVAYVGEDGTHLNDAKIVQLAVSEDIQLCNGVHVGMSKDELISVMGNPMVVNTFDEFEVLTWMDKDSLYVWDCLISQNKVTRVSLTYVTGG